VGLDFYIFKIKLEWTLQSRWCGWLSFSAAAAPLRRPGRI
jgi:hypothetical protein